MTSIDCFFPSISIVTQPVWPIRKAEIMPTATSPEESLHPIDRFMVSPPASIILVRAKKLKFKHSPCSRQARVRDLRIVSLQSREPNICSLGKTKSFRVSRLPKNCFYYSHFFNSALVLRKIPSNSDSADIFLIRRRLHRISIVVFCGIRCTSRRGADIRGSAVSSDVHHHPTDSSESSRQHDFASSKSQVVRATGFISGDGRPFPAVPRRLRNPTARTGRRPEVPSHLFCWSTAAQPKHAKFYSAVIQLFLRILNPISTVRWEMYVPRIAVGCRCGAPAFQGPFCSDMLP
jgi:hypothetical protein